ncbi:hypothetical protein [Actinoplanes sp. HUAS TT8]|uniref:hypothetical protein n=1 Tax=Actinoplanes sp. HUAS TT8 TaxID=3447453 RepID=UPI003F525E37
MIFSQSGDVRSESAVGSEPNSYPRPFLEATSLRIALDEVADASMDIEPTVRADIARQLAELTEAAEKIEQGIMVDTELDRTFKWVDRIRRDVGIGPAQRYRARWFIRG